ncbi:hypothetical protein ANCDUO_02453 [Ancylostoma duodenale]|uniref:Uncharacterized protein n=1 Tax=Ancylostoma duodenale TaxID=51022 RepID=A0A0C2HCE3_9BILA|nr:hypothetical protein ANCDUO_02453 [Ancylostoma duodenale]
MHNRSFAGGFFPQQPRVPQYPRGPQIPAALFYPRSGPGFIPPQANNRQQWFVPPNAAPYWEAPGPIPPQGAYGPTTSTASTHEPMKPSVNPENYDGTIPTQPAANPESFTTANSVSPVTDLVQPHPTRGWYNPTSTVPQHLMKATTAAGDEGVDVTSSMMSIFDSETNPFTMSSTAPSSEMTSPTTETTSSATSSAPIRSTALVIEDITKGWFDEETATSPQTSRATGSTHGEEETTAGTLYSLTTAELPDDIYDHTDVIQDVQEGTTTVASKPTELEQAKANYFPRPVSSQAYQPPGHLPEDFTQHIDVNFLKPNRTCTGPLCGIDADKVSLYNPGKGDGRKGPTLLISNAAKGDAARLGYIPPSPKLISEFTPPPTSTEYYIQKLVPGGPVYAPAEVPGPFPKGEFTTIEPYRPEIPKGPHVFMPPQYFPAPPSPTLVPPAMQTAETTTVSTKLRFILDIQDGWPSFQVPSYSPTAKTIAPPATTEYVTLYTTTEATTRPSTASTPMLNTLPPFESTAKTTEVTTEAYTVPTTSQPSTETQPPLEGVYTTPPEGPVPWSPTYKTVPPSPTTTLSTEAPYTTPTSPRTTVWTPPSEAPTTPSQGTTAATTEYTPTYKTPPTTEGVPLEITTPTEAKTPEATTPGPIPITVYPTETTTTPSTTVSAAPSEATTAGVVYTSEVTEVPTAEISRTTPATTTASTAEYFTITTPSAPPSAPTTAPVSEAPSPPTTTSPTPSTSTPLATTSAILGTSTPKPGVLNRVRGT